MSEYPTGSAKFDPITGSVAVRTSFPEVGPLVPHAWQIASISSGGSTRSSADVETWLDVTLPEVPAQALVASPES